MQLEFTGTVPPDRPSVIAPGVAKAVPPPQLVLAFAGLAMTKPAGKVSDSANMFNVDAFALVTVTVSFEIAPALIVLGKKVLLATGGVKGVLTANTTIG